MKEISTQCQLEIDLSDPGPLPDEAIEQAMALMKTGRLHRYGEYGSNQPHADLLEQEFADYMSSRFAVGVNSGGSAIFIALKIAGVEVGDQVLVNAFNLAPVPGAIHHAGAKAVLVETGADYCIDIVDLRSKIQNSDARVLLLTHMRGHIADMDRVVELCDKAGMTLIEDCAHTMGASWNGRLTGRFGSVGCFSTQMAKHINSGEGGLLITDDEDMAAKAILYSGSYMLYAQHKAAPAEEVFLRHRAVIPNLSMRMSNLVACILRPQLHQLDQRGVRWNVLYRELEHRLNDIDGISVPPRQPREQFIASSIQFDVAGLNAEQLQSMVDACTAQGVAIKWFGREQPMGFTSHYQHWEYLDQQRLRGTTEILSTACDMRIPLSLTTQHCDIIAQVICQEYSNALNNRN